MCFVFFMIFQKSSDNSSFSFYVVSFLIYSVCLQALLITSSFVFLMSIVCFFFTTFLGLLYGRFMYTSLEIQYEYLLVFLGCLFWEYHDWLTTSSLLLDLFQRRGPMLSFFWVLSAYNHETFFVSLLFCSWIFIQQILRITTYLGDYI